MRFCRVWLISTPLFALNSIRKCLLILFWLLFGILQPKHMELTFLLWCVIIAMNIAYLAALISAAIIKIAAVILCAIMCISIFFILFKGKRTLRFKRISISSENSRCNLYNTINYISPTYYIKPYYSVTSGSRYSRWYRWCYFHNTINSSLHFACGYIEYLYYQVFINLS